MNSDATVWKTVGTGYKPNGGSDTDKLSATVSLKRAARLSVNASPEPVVAGKKITVTGTISRANWNTHKYGVYGGRKASLRFKSKGTSTYTMVKKVHANSAGKLSTTVTATEDGTWRWKYYGNSTTGARASAGDYVDVH